MSNLNPGKAISRMFTLPSSPKTPKTPAIDDTAVQMAAVEAAQRRNRSSGYRSTILSSLMSKSDSSMSNGGGQLRSTIGS